MNILKHMEAVFTITVAVACSVSIVLATVSDEEAQAPAAAAMAQTVQPSDMQVVYITAKRMTAAEKRQSLQDEARLAAGGAAKSTF